MAYRHYHTEALILSSRPYGEANRFFQVLTPDFGLISVLAQGVRLEKSKLRYQLTNYSLANLELVRGREYWRLIGAERLEEKANKNQSAFVRKISLILFRLIHGEEASVKIFADLKKAWGLLEGPETQFRVSPKLGFGDNNLEQLEIFIMIRLLADLGYLAKNTETESILSATDFSWLGIESVVKNRLVLIKLINSSLAESGL